MADLRGLAGCCPETLPLPWLWTTSPVTSRCLANYLVDNPDQDFAAYDVPELREGFCIGFSRSIVLHCNARNHPSSLTNAGLVDEHIAQERELGRLVGPISPQLAPKIHTGPIGLIPKPYHAGKSCL